MHSSLLSVFSSFPSLANRPLISLSTSNNLRVLIKRSKRPRLTIRLPYLLLRTTSSLGSLRGCDPTRYRFSADKMYSTYVRTDLVQDMQSYGTMRLGEPPHPHPTPTFFGCGPTARSHFRASPSDSRTTSPGRQDSVSSFPYCTRSLNLIWAQL